MLFSRGALKDILTSIMPGSPLCDRAKLHRSGDLEYAMTQHPDLKSAISRKIPALSEATPIESKRCLYNLM